VAADAANAVAVAVNFALTFALCVPDLGIPAALCSVYFVPSGSILEFGHGIRGFSPNVFGAAPDAAPGATSSSTSSLTCTGTGSRSVGGAATTSEACISGRQGAARKWSSNRGRHALALAITTDPVARLWFTGCKNVLVRKGNRWGYTMLFCTVMEASFRD